MPRQLRLPEPWRRRVYLPAYSVVVSARYSGTNPQTVAYWHYRGGSLGPALPGHESRTPLSYMELVEVAFVATFRRLGVPLQRIRKARDYFGQRFQVEYPFAELRLQTEGHHVLMELLQVEPDTKLKGLIVGDAYGQLAWQEVIADRFLEFDYEYDLAVKWHVAGRQSSVIIDPRVVFGAPNVKGVPTWALSGRRIAGESVPEIAADFGLEEPDVIEALTFEGIQMAA